LAWHWVFTITHVGIFLFLLLFSKEYLKSNICKLWVRLLSISVFKKNSKHWVDSAYLLTSHAIAKSLYAISLWQKQGRCHVEHRSHGSPALKGTKGLPLNGKEMVYICLWSWEPCENGCSPEHSGVSFPSPQRNHARLAQSGSSWSFLLLHLPPALEHRSPGNANQVWSKVD
jgi:hypothetical protein